MYKICPFQSPGKYYFNLLRVIFENKRFHILFWPALYEYKYHYRLMKNVVFTTKLSKFLPPSSSEYLKLVYPINCVLSHGSAVQCFRIPRKPARVKDVN